MPIAMSVKEWERIKRWTNEDRSDPETVRKMEYVKFLDNASREMTKCWPNSVENVNKRNEELRRERIEAAEAANAKFYKKYLKTKKEEQERLMYSARDIVFRNKDAPKKFLSAVIETVTQKERIEQLKFQKELRRLEAEQKRRDDDNIIRKAKEWHQLMADKKKRRFEVDKQHQKEILEQAHEVAERNRQEHETELNLQKIDNMNAKQEMEAIEAFNKKFDEDARNRIFLDMEAAKAQNMARKREQAARDKMDDKLIEVLLRSRARVENRRKQTEKNIKDEKCKILEAISAKLESGDAAREAKDQAILEKAIKQRRDAEDARLEADRRKQEGFQQQRKESREKFLKDEAQRIHEFNTIRQWEIMNRFKNAEIYKDFQKKLHDENRRKINEYREDILKLWKEREDREARELAETRYFYGELAEKKIRDGDNKVLLHAARLLDECRRHGRPDHALHKAVDDYCKMYRLYPMPDLPKGVKEHFQRYTPRDLSNPDPDYNEPPAPPPAKEHKPIGGQGHVPKDNEKRSGLQDTSKAEAVPTKAKSGNVDECEDYKRAGRADGLQRRNLEVDKTLCLPPIKMQQCKDPNCRCELAPKK